MVVRRSPREGRSFSEAEEEKEEKKKKKRKKKKKKRKKERSDLEMDATDAVTDADALEGLIVVESTPLVCVCVCVYVCVWVCVCVYVCGWVGARARPTRARHWCK